MVGFIVFQVLVNRKPISFPVNSKKDWSEISSKYSTLLRFSVVITILHYMIKVKIPGEHYYEHLLTSLSYSHDNSMSCCQK